MKNDLFEVLNIAIMTKISSIIVEGKDDKQIYYRIGEQAEKEVEIFSVNMIEGCALDLGNCDKVIECIEKLQPKFDELESNLNAILGVIDRDVRPYRPADAGQISVEELRGLFILDYYSFETYFANRVVLRKMIEKLTHLTTNMINEDLINLVEGNFQTVKNELYYISLEALKNSCIHDYSGAVGYANDGVRDNNRRQQLYTQIEHKIPDLNTFAESLSINIDDLRLICKGKWYLHVYIEKMHEMIRNLSNMCGSESLTQCTACQADASEECNYLAKSGYQTNALCNDATEYVTLNEFESIINRFRALL
jgi:hypothetical protein